MEHLNELQEKKLEKIANEIYEERKKIGQAIYGVGNLETNGDGTLLDRTSIAIEILGLGDMSYKEIYICLSLYLEAKANEK